MAAYIASRTVHYTEYYLIELPEVESVYGEEADELMDEVMSEDRVRVPISPYITYPDRDNENRNWHPVPDEEVEQIEQHYHTKRHRKEKTHD